MFLEKSRRYNEQKEGLDEHEGQALSSSVSWLNCGITAQKHKKGKVAGWKNEDCFYSSYVEFPVAPGYPEDLLD